VSEEQAPDRTEETVATPRRSRARRSAADEVRDAQFPTAMRGYDRAAVDTWCQEIADLVERLEEQPPRDTAVKRALDEVGQETTAILQRAHEAAEEITSRSRSQADARLERAERETDAVRRHAYLTFVVVGGGPTGVEMAGAVAEIRRYALRRDFRHIDPREATVLLLEGGTRLLTSYPPKLSDEAKQQLRRLGVEVRTETLVTDIRPGSVTAAGWTIPTQTVIWAAGNTASPLLKTMGTPLDDVGRAIVEPDCTIAGRPEVFVLGDAAAFTQKGELLPGTCPVAIQMGQYTARTIEGDLAGRPRRSFRYWDKGQLAVVGRGRAVADIWKLHFGGFLAWLIWIFVHIAFLIGFRNRLLVMIQWAWSYLTYGRGARLITEEIRPAAAPAAVPPARPPVGIPVRAP